MQRSSEDGQMSKPVEPAKEPSDPVSSESSQDTLAIPEKKFVRPEDFDYVDFADAEFSDDEVEDFKKLLLGRELPPQTDSDEELRAIGCKGPHPWATFWLEQRIMNS